MNCQSGQIFFLWIVIWSKVLTCSFSRQFNNNLLLIIVNLWNLICVSFDQHELLFNLVVVAIVSYCCGRTVISFWITKASVNHPFIISWPQSIQSWTIFGTSGIKGFHLILAVISKLVLHVHNFRLVRIRILMQARLKGSNK